MRYRGRHRQVAPPRRTRRLATVATLTASVVLAPLALTGPAVSRADGVPGGVGITTERLPEAYTETMNRVYGVVGDVHRAFDQNVDPAPVYDAVDGLHDGIDQAVDLAALQEDIKEKYPTVMGEDPVNMVVGTVTTAQGVAMAGVTIVLELIPSDGYDPIGDGSLVWELSRTVTDAAGQFIALVPTTEQVLAEAEYLNGTVNMMVTALKYEATERGYGMYLAAGAIYSAMVDYGPGVGGVALAPVNVGLIVIEDTKAMAGASGLVEVTPGNDPDDASTLTVDRPDVRPDGTEGLPGAPAVSEPYVETPVSLNTSFVALPPNFPEIPADFAKDDEAGAATGDSRCKYPRNQGRWLVDSHDAGTEWQPVGEVHSVPGLKVKYVYSERANTQIGAAIKEEGKSWKISGGVSITNDSGAETDKQFQPDSFARRVEGQFVFHHNRKTWCPDGYDEDDGPHALHMEEIVGKTWTGGVQYGSRDISDRDNGNEWEKAHDEVRDMDFFAGDTWTKTKGKTYKYTVDVSAFGVGLNAESVNDVNHTMVLVAGHSRDKWHLFGDLDVPASPANHAIYAYY